MAGLRARGITQLAILSGYHDAPTRRLAEQLGMDMHFAEVLPEQKAAFIARLQREGKKVCFIGDGLNVAIALKKADVSISLRGATSIATDTADILFLDEGLGRLCELRDIACDLDRNVRRSWQMLVVPNAVCVAGVFALGWGVMASVVLNNISALAALANGLVPMRKAMALEQDRVARKPTTARPTLRIAAGSATSRTHRAHLGSAQLSTAHSLAAPTGLQPRLAHHHIRHNSTPRH